MSLCYSNDVFVQLCRELDESLPPRRSVIYQAMKYCRSLAVPFDYTSCDFMCAVICGKQLHSLTTSLLEKPLHGCFYSFLNMNDVDKQSTFVWLRQYLHFETESSVVAIQNQVIATGVIESKVMYKSVPSIMRLKKLFFIYYRPVLSLF